MIKLANNIEEQKNIDLTDNELQYLYEKGNEELMDIKKISKDFLSILNTTVLGKVLLQSLATIPEVIINTTNNILPALLVGEYDIYLDTSSDYNKDDLEEARQELYNKLKDTYL